MTRSKTLRILTVLALVTVAPVAVSQSSGFEITPTVGYRFDRPPVGFDGVADSLSFGLTAEIAVQPNLNVEVLWSHQDTELKPVALVPLPSSVPSRLSHLNIDTLQIGGLHLFGRPEDRTRGFVEALVGASILTPAPQLRSFTRFSASIGGGAKIRVSDRIGVRLGLRWMPIYINSAYGGYVYCVPSGGCRTFLSSSVLYQTDAHAGLIVKF